MAGIVDSHSHFFSRVFFETLAEASTLPGSREDRMWAVAQSMDIELPSPSLDEHLSQWLSEMKRYGVDHLVTFASVPQEAPTVARAVAKSEGRLSALVVVDPKQPEAAERLEARLTEDGFRGALVFPAMHRFEPEGAELARVLDVLDAHAGIVVVHCGLLRIGLRDRFGLPRAYDLSLANPLRIVPAADAHPNARFVIPHFGAGLLRETLLAGAQCPNVYVDTSSSNGWMSTQTHPVTLVDVFERTLGVFGPERILFGTDSSVFPRGWRRDVLLAQREALGACGVSDADFERILGGNTSRILAGH